MPSSRPTGKNTGNQRATEPAHALWHGLVVPSARVRKGERPLRVGLRNGRNRLGLGGNGRAGGPSHEGALWPVPESVVGLPRTPTGSL